MEVVVGVRLGAHRSKLDECRTWLSAHRIFVGVHP